MAPVSIVFGLLLIVLGLVGYFQPAQFGAVGPEGTSPTALIPAGIGAILLLCGAIAQLNPAARKHAMHAAAAFALIGAIGGFMPLMRSKMDFEKASAVSGVLMIVLCALYVAICVRSFLRARAARAVMG